MKRAIGALMLSVAVAVPAFAQQQTGAPAGIPVPPPPSGTAARAETDAPESRSFRVRLLDGRNGTPVAGGHVRLWYDEPTGEGYTVVTDSRGMALMPAPVGQPVRILADVPGQTDCRRSQRYAQKPAYILADIAAKGVAADNTCGDAGFRPEPGELLLFVRPPRWYEKLNQNADRNIP